MNRNYDNQKATREQKFKEILKTNNMKHHETKQSIFKKIHRHFQHNKYSGLSLYIKFPQKFQK